MPLEQIFIGSVSAALCLAGIWHDRWLLTETKKGKRLVAWFGEHRALWVLRGLLAAGLLFGVLLATNVIRPIRW